MGKQMMAYIYEQPVVWQSILDGQAALCAQACRQWAGQKRVLIVGSGSSYNAACSAQQFFEAELGFETTVVTSTAACAKAAQMNPQTTQVLVISQSGRSTNTEAAVEQMTALHYGVITVTGNAQSGVARKGNAHVLIPCGEETVPAKTKGMTATVLTLYSIGLQAALACGTIDASKAEQLMALLSTACGHAKENIDRSIAFCQTNLPVLATQPHYTLIADGMGLPVAAEGALKLLETLYVPASAYEFEEYLHGVNNTMTAGRAHIFMPTHPAQHARMETLLRYSDALGCLNYRISLNAADGDKRTLVLLGSGNPCTVPFESILPFQVLSSLGSDYKGGDCDHPRFADFYDVMSTKTKA